MQMHVRYDTKLEHQIQELYDKIRSEISKENERLKNESDMSIMKMAGLGVIAGTVVTLALKSLFGN